MLSNPPLSRIESTEHLRIQSSSDVVLRCYEIAGFMAERQDDIHDKNTGFTGDERENEVPKDLKGEMAWVLAVVGGPAVVDS